MKTLVVIPYRKAGAQGNELALAIRGWRLSFTEDFDLVVIGDKEDYFERMGVTHVAHQSEMVDPPLDIAAKMVKIMELYPDRKGMVWSNDDIYAVNPFTLKDIKAIKMIGALAGIENSNNHFKRNMYRTRKILEQGGYPIRNHCNHLPAYYDFDKLKALMDEYDLLNEPYLIGSLYCNRYYKTTPFIANLLSSTDKYKCGIYTADYPLDKVREALVNKIWINNSSVGYRPEIIQLIAEHYDKIDAALYADLHDFAADTEAPIEVDTHAETNEVSNS